MTRMPSDQPQSMSDSRALLSVCMIVRDEADHLPRCLNSVVPVSDEIIIVDTGSTDGSQEIARSYGAKVFEHPWQKDFSLHRNQSIGYARSDWILQIDADETLSEVSAPGLRNLLSSAPESLNGYLVRIENLDRRGQRNAMFYYPRMYRNRIGVVYKSSVHNQVIIPGRLAHSDIVLYHHGYDLEPEKMAKKIGRTESLLLARLERDPDDLSALCNLTHTYSMARQFQRAVETGERAVTLLSRQPGPAPAHLGVTYPLVTSHIALGNLYRALELCEFGLAIEPGYVDLHYQRTRAYAKAHQFALVLRSGDAYHQARQWVVANPERMSTLTLYTLDLAFRVHYWQGLAAIATGELQRADHHLSHTLASPELTYVTCRELMQNLGRIEPGPLIERWIQGCLRRYPELGHRQRSGLTESLSLG